MFDDLDKTKNREDNNVLGNQKNILNSAKQNNNVQQKTDSQAGSNSQNKEKNVEDIFQETDKFSSNNKNLPPDIPKEQLERMKAGDNSFFSDKHRPYKAPVSKGVKPIRTIILIILVVGIIGFGSYYLYDNVFMVEEDNQEENNQEENLNNTTEEEKKLNNNTEEEEENLNNNTEEEDMEDPLTEEQEKINEEKELKAKDSDADGLNDWEEINFYKINPLNSDSDADGLKDGDEILIYKTDPLDIDSDKDGYNDGDEANNGYNPLGEGKLSL
jgi:hypothetical protein